MFVLGATVGACRLLGRGRGFAGAADSAAASVAFAVPLAIPLALVAEPDDLAAGATEGRGAVRAPARDVRDSMGREVEGCAEAAEGGRATLGREVDVPLKDCREEAREGTEDDDGPRTTTPDEPCKRTRATQCTYT